MKQLQLQLQQQPLSFSFSTFFTFAQKLNLQNNLNFIDIIPFFIVALIWGSTDVQIASCSKQSKQQFNAVDFSPMNLIKFIISKKIWIWIGLNQVGSVLYAYLLGVYPQQFSLIWANCLTVLIAFLIENFYNNKQQIKKGKMLQNTIGIIFIMIGLYLMLI